MRRVAVAALCAGAAAADLHASIRADKWLADFVVNGQPAPKTGRRVHIAASVGAKVSDADLASVTVNGEECLNLPDGGDADLTYYDWCRAHANAATGQLWVSFHTRNAAWTSGAALAVKASAADGSVLASGSVTPVDPPLVLSYVTTQKNGAQAVVHIHSAGGAASVDRLLFDGAEVAVGNLTVPAGGHAVVVAALPTPKKRGDVWTAALFAGGGAGAGYGGRLTGERYPVQVWPRSTDCPLPGGNDANAAELRNLGIDSVFYTEGNYNSNCGGDGAYTKALNNISASGDGWFHVFLGDDKLYAKDLPAETRAKVVDAILVSDEGDGDIDAKHLRKPLTFSLANIRDTPDVPTYQGSATNANVGAFSGITDIQGSDAYSAACAPTQLAVTKTLPLQYPYFYLRNARDNHAPLTFLGYSQLYSGDGDALGAPRWSYQANANELVAQIAMTVLSGSKGIMMFQSEQSAFEAHDVAKIKQTLMSMRAVSETIMSGDIAGVAFKVSSTLNKEVMVETILSPTQLLVTIINTDASGYSNLLCHTGVSKHWNFKQHTIDTLTLALDSAPQVAKVANWREAVGGDIQPLAGVAVSGESGAVTLSKIALDDKLVARFLIADVTLR